MLMMSQLSRLPLLLGLSLAIGLAAPMPAHAAASPFDLAGPGLQIAVTHNGRTLPIARVPNLSEGDRLSIKLDLPEEQGARMLLIAAFLRGATNPPPKDWFFKSKTWKKGGTELSLTVPAGARQIVLFLAPDDNSDYDAVVEAVRERPGTFVRASQELNQASLDRARLDRFLGQIRWLEATHPDRIAAASPVLTRSLSIKLNAQCLDQPTDLQAACLTQNRETLLLADTHTSALAETLAGAPTDLAYRISSTRQAGYGYYSPYIGVVRDIARLFGAFQSTQLQYIPALSRIDDDRVTLLLNAAPNFGRPTSVMVVALPSIEPPRVPPLRHPATLEALCAAPGTVLPVDGAPLVYATRYAQNMRLRVVRENGPSLDLPVTADPMRGGYVLAAPVATYHGLGATITGTLHGDWGFAQFDGPTFSLANPEGAAWATVSRDAAVLPVGRDNAVELIGGAPACVDRITMADGAPLAWKPGAGNRLSVTVPVAPAAPDALTLLVHPKGGGAPVSVALATTTEQLRLDRLTLHANDSSAELTGTGLDKVTAVSLGGLALQPGAILRADGTDRLSLAAVDPQKVAALDPGHRETATVTLADGRERSLPVVVAAPRPAATLIGLTATPVAAAGQLPIAIADTKVVPLGAPLTFSFRAAPATRLTGRETIEIATVDGRLSARIAPGAGYAVQNAGVGVVKADLAATLGASAYGPLRFRILQDGVSGAWAPLATLVRLPTLDGLRCDDQGCHLTGSDLYLLASVATTADGAAATEVPDGFTGTMIAIPQPATGQIFLRLRDDPAAAATVTLR
ncbi:hypothetical protein ACFO8O_00165 [Hephaestia sp. GCM10023244]|uniref:hypothetical protein n=1 Tax=unclassified Hephaestia TaxID=2631281 RepID=UPI0020771771|nr:hypothetical protein [Hephaestia sp. MAHUQ-44]MCM8729380.1 hypothetical protein [Hephaestia sp. MAHUQ-44]